MVAKGVAAVKPVGEGKDLPMFTLDDIAKCRNTSSGPIFLSIKGVVYDVSSARNFYGSGGGYSVFAGNDVTYAFSVMSLKAEDMNKFDFELTEKQKKTLQEWINKFNEKYKVVGMLEDYQKKVQTKMDDSKEGIHEDYPNEAKEKDDADI